MWTYTSSNLHSGNYHGNRSEMSDDQSPPLTASIQSQLNQTNNEQDREPAPPNKVQGLITELSTPTKGESDKADENEIPDGSLSQSIPKSDQSRKTRDLLYAYQGEIWCWYYYAKGFEKRL
ncbi:2683_t:CDS:2 [Paraglomus brasilianum]|uniref:2683_t:CDS:1 n=1 Tax=Paraglomus brasilianum TaxID=144538 RepID=A0A9N9AR59_9GLOM|nr:2683_t:CDS:2 [Paraglomus brasilianum]